MGNGCRKPPSCSPGSGGQRWMCAASRGLEGWGASGQKPGQGHESLFPCWPPELTYQEVLSFKPPEPAQPPGSLDMEQ